MFGFDESRNAHQEVYSSGGYENQAKFSQELVAGAAAFEGMKQWEDHQRREGTPPRLSHPRQRPPSQLRRHRSRQARFAETKGLDFYHQEEAQHRAKQGADRMYEDHYGDVDEYRPQERDSLNFR